MDLQLLLTTIKQAREHLLAVVGIISLAAAGVAWMDARYMHTEDIVMRDLMSKSTRYAEITHHYMNKMQDGEELSEADKKRLKLAQTQQIRIAKIILGEEEE